MKNLEILGFKKNDTNTGYIIQNEKQLFMLVGHNVSLFCSDFDNGNLYAEGTITRIDKINKNEYLIYNGDTIMFLCEYFSKSSGRYDINGKFIEDNSFKAGMYSGDDMDMLSVNLIS